MRLTAPHRGVGWVMLDIGCQSVSEWLPPVSQDEDDVRDDGHADVDDRLLPSPRGPGPDRSVHIRCGRPDRRDVTDSRSTTMIIATSAPRRREQPDVACQTTGQLSAPVDGHTSRG